MCVECEAAREPILPSDCSLYWLSLSLYREQLSESGKSLSLLSEHTLHLQHTHTHITLSSSCQRLNRSKLISNESVLINQIKCTFSREVGAGTDGCLLHCLSGWLRLCHDTYSNTEMGLACHVLSETVTRYKVGQTRGTPHETSPHCKRSRSLRSLGVCGLHRPNRRQQTALISSLSGGPTGHGNSSPQGPGNMSVSR